MIDPPTRQRLHKPCCSRSGTPERRAEPEHDTAHDRAA